MLLHRLAEAADSSHPPAGGDWAERVRCVAQDPELEERLLAEADARLQQRGERHLFVFDALDRLGDDWKAIRELLRGLLRVCLDLRAYRAIRTKLFLRPDVWEDQAIWGFPDASKLHHGRVLLEWRRVDLYGLLWHWMGNHPEAGEPFRDWCESVHGHRFAPIPIGDGVVLIEAVIEIGVMSRIADGRLNMPDLFRVAASIGRRGGVRAIR